ncbi:hypothetical protein HH219_02590 [Pseudoalteromonas sp. NEC-BIFX-2020_015]|uniref:FecR family protein n=1 Tax=Pseudoalteromonas sp. NEC-BIFX-2020_015 TaxID=2729544 RepID=UPI0014615000|nr:FecR domain-containing protein [Pseudoalteromonas sp. NEC-BIFX-2020_015]NMR24448.1 hypothetical protein [Pseudoalteromonas sp. NEC-BIFX-2020_015]
MTPSPDDLSIIEEQAADWLLLLEEKNSTEYPKALNDWLAQSKLHSDIFYKMQQLWQLSAQLDTTYVTEQLADIESISIVTPSEKKQPLTRYFAIAAAFCLLSFTIFINTDRPVRQSIAVTTKTSPAINIQNEFFQTAINEHKSITLADNSRVNLGANSQLAVRYSDTFRELTLYQGEALFSVSKDKRRPFIVRHQQSQVEALGTVFNVRANPSSIRVDVLEGVVSVAQQHIIKLTQGQAAEVTKTGAVIHSRALGDNLMMDWQQGRLVYQNARLGDVLNDVARYSDLQITLDNQELAQLTYNGTLLTSEIDSWVNSLDKIYPITISQQGSLFVLTAN